MPRLREWKWQAWAEHTAACVRLAQPERIAFDTETEGIGFYDPAFAATLTWRNKIGELESGYIALEGEGVERRVEMLGEILRSVPQWVFWNAKFDLQKAVLMGALTYDDIVAERVLDGQTLFALLYENEPKALKKASVSVLGIDDTVEVSVKSGPNRGQTKRVPKEAHVLAAARRKLKLTKADGYHLLPRAVVVPYAIRDTELTLQTFEALWPRLEALKDPRLVELFYEFMELKVVLLSMEADGFALDLEYLSRVASEYGVKVMEGWDRIVQLTGKPELNPQSPAQLLEVFAERGVILESTAEAALKEVTDELAEALLQYRSVKKIHQTYLVALQHEQRDGIVHPNFNDDAAKTGRMSSSAASNN